MEDKFISFTKEYSNKYYIDEYGNELKGEEMGENRLSYKGQFDEKQILLKEHGKFGATKFHLEKEALWILIQNWEISKDSKKYGL